MIPGVEVVFDNKYYLSDLVESVTLEDALDEIAYSATVQFVVTPDFPEVAAGKPMRVSSLSPGDNPAMQVLLDGLVWSREWVRRGQKRLSVDIFDRTIYLARSEDEYLFPAGQTATQRLKRYAGDWAISLGTVAETGVTLGKSVYRAQSIYSMIKEDLAETAEKGGGLYRARINGPQQLELIKLGSNKKVWMLELIEEQSDKESLEGAVTQVKVLGSAIEDELSEVLALVKDDANLKKYGVLQRVVSSEKIEDASQATTVGKRLLGGPLSTIDVSGPDINEIRAGDKVVLDNQELLVARVKHELGVPGRMNLELATEDVIRRMFYARSIQAVG